MVLTRTARTGRWLAFGGAVALAACASSPAPPETELAAAELAVGEAEEADARTHAPVLLQQAQEKLARARQAVEGEAMVDARRLAEQATVDAQLAEAQARATIAQSNLREVQEGVDQLRERTLTTPPDATTGG